MFDKYNVPYVVIDKQYEEDSAFNVGVEAIKNIIKHKINLCLNFTVKKTIRVTKTSRKYEVILDENASQNKTSNALQGVFDFGAYQNCFHHTRLQSKRTPMGKFLSFARRV